jgi:hypothetical protein
MPFVSKKQQRFAFATKQPWAKEWASKTDFSTLPESVPAKKDSKGKKKVKKQAARRGEEEEEEQSSWWPWIGAGAGIAALIALRGLRVANRRRMLQNFQSEQVDYDAPLPGYEALQKLKQGISPTRGATPGRVELSPSPTPASPAESTLQAIQFLNKSGSSINVIEPKFDTQWDTPQEMQESKPDELFNATQTYRAHQKNQAVEQGLPNWSGNALPAGGGVPGAAKPAAPAVAQTEASELLSATPGPLIGTAPTPPASDASLSMPTMTGATPPGEQKTALARGLVSIVVEGASAKETIAALQGVSSDEGGLKTGVGDGVYGKSASNLQRRGQKDAGNGHEGGRTALQTTPQLQQIDVSLYKTALYLLKRAQPLPPIPAPAPGIPGTTQTPVTSLDNEMSRATQALEGFVNKTPAAPLPQSPPPTDQPSGLGPNILANRLGTGPGARFSTPEQAAASGTMGGMGGLLSGEAMERTAAYEGLAKWAAMQSTLEDQIPVEDVPWQRNWDTGTFDPLWGGGQGGAADKERILDWINRSEAAAQASGAGMRYSPYELGEHEGKDVWWTPDEARKIVEQAAAKLEPGQDMWDLEHDYPFEYRVDWPMEDKPGWKFWRDPKVLSDLEGTPHPMAEMFDEEYDAIEERDSRRDHAWYVARDKAIAEQKDQILQQLDMPKSLGWRVENLIESEMERGKPIEEAAAKVTAFLSRKQPDVDDLQGLDQDEGNAVRALAAELGITSPWRIDEMADDLWEEMQVTGYDLPEAIAELRERYSQMLQKAGFIHPVNESVEKRAAIGAAAARIGRSLGRGLRHPVGQHAAIGTGLTGFQYGTGMMDDMSPGGQLTQGLLNYTVAPRLMTRGLKRTFDRPTQRKLFGGRAYKQQPILGPTKALLGTAAATRGLPTVVGLGDALARQTPAIKEWAKDPKAAVKILENPTEWAQAMGRKLIDYGKRTIIDPKMREVGAPALATFARNLGLTGGLGLLGTLGGTALGRTMMPKLHGASYEKRKRRDRLRSLLTLLGGAGAGLGGLYLARNMALQPVQMGGAKKTASARLARLRAGTAALRGADKAATDRSKHATPMQVTAICESNGGKGYKPKQTRGWNSFGEEAWSDMNKMLTKKPDGTNISRKELRKESRYRRLRKFAEQSPNFVPAPPRKQTYVGEEAVLPKEEIDNLIHQFSESTGANLDKMPVMVDEEQPWRNVGRYYMPQTLAQVPSRLGHLAMLPLNWPLLFAGDSSMKGVGKGDYYMPSLGTVSATKGDPATLAHEVGHWVDFEQGGGPYSHGWVQKHKDSPFKNLPYMGPEMSATLWARQAMGEDMWQQEGEEGLYPALASYIIGTRLGAENKGLLDKVKGVDLTPDKDWKENLPVAIQTGDPKQVQQAWRKAIQAIIPNPEGIPSDKVFDEDLDTGKLKWSEKTPLQLKELTKLVMDTEYERLYGKPAGEEQRQEAIEEAREQDADIREAARAAADN